MVQPRLPSFFQTKLSQLSTSHCHFKQFFLLPISFPKKKTAFGSSFSHTSPADSWLHVSLADHWTSRTVTLSLNTGSPKPDRVWNCCSTRNLCIVLHIVLLDISMYILKWSKYLEIKFAKEGLLGSLYDCFHWRYTANNSTQIPPKCWQTASWKKQPTFLYLYHFENIFIPNTLQISKALFRYLVLTMLGPCH